MTQIQNTLRYIALDRAVYEIESFCSIPDGTVVTATVAQIEGRDLPQVKLIEEYAGSQDWRRVYGDRLYHYELLVARKGITEVLDAYGDPCGFRVTGTARANC